MEVPELDLVQISRGSVMRDLNSRGNRQQIVVASYRDVVVVHADGNCMDPRGIRYIVCHHGDSANTPGCTIDENLTVACDKGRRPRAHIEN